MGLDRHNHPGSYITDEIGLYRVVKASGREMLLEDCLHPDLPLLAITAKELREDSWRPVKPLKEPQRTL